MITAREAREETFLNWTPENKIAEAAKQLCENEINKCIQEQINKESAICIGYRNKKLLEEDFYSAVRKYLRDNGYVIEWGYYDDQINIYWGDV